MFHDGIEEVLSAKYKIRNIPSHVTRIPRCIQSHSFYYEVPEGVRRMSRYYKTLRGDARTTFRD